MTEPSKEAMERACGVCDELFRSLTPPPEFIRLIALVIDAAVAAEREACAKIADEFNAPIFDESAQDIANLIRSRP